MAFEFGVALVALGPPIEVLPSIASVRWLVWLFGTSGMFEVARRLLGLGMCTVRRLVWRFETSGLCEAALGPLDLEKMCGYDLGALYIVS